MARALALLLLLAGCSAGPVPLASSAGGCSLFETMRLAVAGRDCAHPPKLPPAPYCTRSLAAVDCWRDPQALASVPPQVADGGWQAPAVRPMPVSPPAVQAQAP